MKEEVRRSGLMLESVELAVQAGVVSRSVRAVR
jgi:hypothetical protein